MVIEAATDNNIAAEMRSRILEPLNLENTFFAEEENIPGGYVSGYIDFDLDGTLDNISVANLSWSWTSGAIISNTEDLTKFIQALQGEELLSPETRAEMFTLVDTQQGYSYGLGIMSFETPDLGTVIGHRGGTLGFNSNLWYSSEDDFTYVDLANGRSNERLVENIIPAFTEGIIPTVGNTIAYDEFNFTITESDAQIRLPVANDGEIEGEETVTFTVEAGEGYSVNPNAQTQTFTILDSSDFFGTDGDDELVGTDTNESIKALAGDDLVAGLLGNDTVFGGDGDDTLRGDLNSRSPGGYNGGDDVISGGAGNDQIGGKAGNDLLSGDAGDDEIFGDDGNDTIMGVTGNDTLTGDDFSGGSGSDLFVFGNGDGTDTITDFDITEDLIGLVEGELTFEELSITDGDMGAMISVIETGETLAVLQGVNADELTPELFTVTPDVSFG